MLLLHYIIPGCRARPHEPALPPRKRLPVQPEHEDLCFMALDIVEGAQVGSCPPDSQLRGEFNRVLMTCASSEREGPTKALEGCVRQQVV